MLNDEEYARKLQNEELELYIKKQEFHNIVLSNEEYARKLQNEEFEPFINQQENHKKEQSIKINDINDRLERDLVNIQVLAPNPASAYPTLTDEEIAIKLWNEECEPFINQQENRKIEQAIKINDSDARFERDQANIQVLAPNSAPAYPALSDEEIARKLQNEEFELALKDK